MRYLKTYESFSTNEEFLGGLFNKIKTAFANWKNEKMKKAGETLAKAIEEKKDQPEMAKALTDLKAAYAALPQEDKAKIESFKDEKNIPVSTEVAKEEEIMAESLILEEEGLALKILGWLGSICLAICGIPQAWQSIKDKHSHGISWGFVLLWAFGEIFALAYVYDKLDLPLLLNYATNILILGVILYFKINPKNTVDYDKEVRRFH